MIKVLKVNSVDSWGNLGRLYTSGFNRRFAFLKKYYCFEVSNDPDFVFSFCYSDDDFKKNFAKLRKQINIRSGVPIIFNSWEGFAYPNMELYDYAVGTHYIDHPRYKRIPGYFYFMYWQGFTPNDLVKQENFSDRIMEQKRKFCSFLHSRDYFERNIFVALFSKLYKKVDCGGRCINNIGGVIPGGNSFIGNDDLGVDKLQWVSQYKFNMALQSRNVSGYTDENIMDAMLCGTIPIFYGNPVIEKEFNPKSFIHIKNYNNPLNIYKRIREIDLDDFLYKDMLQEPWYYENRVPDKLQEESWMPFFKNIFS